MHGLSLPTAAFHSVCLNGQVFYVIVLHALTFHQAALHVVLLPCFLVVSGVVDGDGPHPVPLHGLRHTVGRGNSLLGLLGGGWWLGKHSCLKLGIVQNWPPSLPHFWTLVRSQLLLFSAKTTLPLNI